MIEKSLITGKGEGQKSNVKVLACLEVTEVSSENLCFLSFSSEIRTTCTCVVDEDVKVLLSIVEKKKKKTPLVQVYYLVVALFLLRMNGLDDALLEELTSLRDEIWE